MPPHSGPEYRIQGKDPKGKLVQGYVTATSYLAARKKARSIARTQQWTVISIRKKKNFVYRVRRGNKVVEGVQGAYSRQEVVSALSRLGFEVRSVRRYYDFRFQASSNELVSFIGVSATLLEQKVPYSEVLRIMSNNVRDKNLRRALRDIINDLKNGVDSRDAFERQGKVLGRETALMLGIASKSGDMKAIFQSVSHFVERQADFKKGLISSLILPAVTSVALIGAIVFYVLYLLPQMADLMSPMTSSLPPLTAMTLEISAWIKDNLALIVATIVISMVSFYGYILTTRGRLMFDRFLIRVPYIGRVLRNSSVEMFCRVLGITYTAGENIDAIHRAAESSRNRFLEKQIKTLAIPTMLKYGTELARALEWTTFFPEMVISRFKTAAETGTVKATAIQLADFYEMENRYAMKNLISFIEVGISVLIMFTMIFLTFLSSETASLKIDRY
ncbi:MAG: type II secretion system F family protein [Bacteroidota bacterium]